MQFIKAFKNKSSIEKIYQRERQRRLISLKEESMYTAHLFDKLKFIEKIFDNSNVKSIILEIPDKYIYHFLKAIYRDEFSIYNIVQDSKKPNRFMVSKKLVDI